jgi:hypothetical protein
MAVRATSDATHAVIVGIDGYDVGTSWDLKFAVEDALAFAQWLHDRLVPRDNVRLFLSPCQGRKEQLDGADKLGVLASPCTQALMDCFEKDLPANGMRSELLLLYWAGHGVTDDLARHLLLADTIVDAKRTIHFESLRRLLQSTRYRNHLTQVVIVDTCANSYADYRPQTALSSASFAHTQYAAQGLIQFVAFAASNGQKAADGAGETKAAFGRRFLREMGDSKRVEWPDFPAIFAKVEAEIKSEPGMHQTPVSYIFNNGKDGDMAIGSMARLGPSLPMEALALIGGLDLNDAELRRCYYLSATDRGAAPPVDNLERMLRALHDMTLPASGLAPLVAFVARIAFRQHIPELRDWVARHVPAKVDLTRLENQVAQEEADGQAAVWFLTVQLGPASAADELQPERAWLWDAAGKPAKQWPDDPAVTASLVLGVVINEAQVICDPAHLILELAVPMPDLGRDFAAMDVPVGPDKESAIPVCLGDEFGVVLRAKERLSGGGQNNPLVRFWHKAAQTLCKRWSSAGYRVAWLNVDDPARSIDNCLLNDKDSGLFGLRFVPPPLSAAAGHPLIGAVRKGIPFIFWVTQEPDNWDGAVARLDALCAAAKGPGLFLEVRKLRANVADTGHLGAKLKVLWDDPARNPSIVYKNPGVRS